MTDNDRRALSGTENLFSEPSTTDPAEHARTVDDSPAAMQVHRSPFTPQTPSTGGSPT